MNSAFIGVDVQKNRGCCFSVIDNRSEVTESGWLTVPHMEIKELIGKLRENCQVLIGIDAPRQPLITPREWYWVGRQRRWRRRHDERGYGRHCEVVIKAHGLANPQWTPVVPDIPDWMDIGFRLFHELEDSLPVYEVFPTASYSVLSGVEDVRLNINFSACWPGPKDMLDAFVAAATVRELFEGRGQEVGGGDGLGTIILPRPLPDPVIQEVLEWPE